MWCSCHSSRPSEGHCQGRPQGRPQGHCQGHPQGHHQGQPQGLPQDQPGMMRHSKMSEEQHYVDQLRVRLDALLDAAEKMDHTAGHAASTYDHYSKQKIRRSVVLKIICSITKVVIKRRLKIRLRCTRVDNFSASDKNAQHGAVSTLLERY